MLFPEHEQKEGSLVSVGHKRDVGSGELDGQLCWERLDRGWGGGRVFKPLSHEKTAERK